MKELPLALRSINCLRPRVAIKNRGVEWRGVFLESSGYPN